MRSNNLLQLCALCVLSVLTVANLWVANTRIPPRWVRGALHVHSFLSDGSASPWVMMETYRAAGYDFVALTDHDTIPSHKVATDILDFAELSGLHGEGTFLLLSGEEVSWEGAGLPVHTNVLNLDDVVEPEQHPTVVAALRAQLRRVEELRKPGVPVVVQLNHPNWKHAVRAEDLLPFPEIPLMEVYNPHDDWRGDAVHPSTERLWDVVLADRFSRPERRPLFGTATDDAHRPAPEVIGGTNNGWVMVRADDLHTGSILTALRTGQFYASSGVMLDEVVADRTGLALEIAPREGARFQTAFVGARRNGPPGEVLARVTGLSASYAFRGDELYVRARVESSLRHPADWRRLQTAWIQPVEGPACPWPPSPSREGPLLRRPR